MTEKDLHKLRRRDLLQLLLTQGEEAAALQNQLEKTETELKASQEGNERLKEKLNQKDELIEKLKGRLDEKDARIRELEEGMEEWKSDRRIELEEAGSIAEAALRLHDIFGAAQKAADQYLYNLRLMNEKESNEQKENPNENSKEGKSDDCAGDAESGTDSGGAAQGTI
nr:hypothetical protein [uncultured Blautia sp.]